MDLFLKSGVFGLFIVFAFFVIFLTEAIVIGVTRSRRNVSVFVFLAFIPLLLGFCGTYLGNVKVDQTLEGMAKEGIQHEQAVVDAGRRDARASTYLGLLGSSVLLVAAGTGYMLTSTNQPQN